MPALVLDERIYETSVTTGTGEYTLAGAVTGFQPASVIGTTNYLYGFVTDDTNWEAGIYTYFSGPDRLQRTHVVASSNADAAVNWGAGTKKLRCGALAFFGPGRQVSKSVAGAVDVTLTALEQRCDQLILTGVLTGNINVIVDTTKARWYIYNNTSGAFTLTVKTSAGTGVAVTQGKRAVLACDGVNVVSALSTLPVADITGLGAGVAAALAINVGSAGAPVTFNGVLGTPSSGSAANLTGFPAASDTAAGVIEIAVQSEMETGTDTTRAVVPGRQHFHPSAAKAWVQFNGTGTVAIALSHNVGSITDNGVGDYTVNFNTAFSSVSYAVGGWARDSGVSFPNVTGHSTTAPAAASCRVSAENGANVAADLSNICLVFFGDQ